MRVDEVINESVHVPSTVSNIVIPAGVVFQFNLDLSGCSNVTLNERVSVIGNLKLSGCSNVTLNKLVRVNGDLDLENSTNLTLNAPLNVGNDVNLNNSDLNELPTGAEVRVTGDDTEIHTLSGTRRKNDQNGFNIGGNLSMKNCNKINKLP